MDIVPAFTVIGEDAKVMQQVTGTLIGKDGVVEMSLRQGSQVSGLLQTPRLGRH